MSAAAKPIVTLYLRIASPFVIARAASLLPAGIWLRHERLSRPSFVPIARSVRAIRTLSFSCRRMAIQAAGFSLISITGNSQDDTAESGGFFTLRTQAYPDK